MAVDMMVCCVEVAVSNQEEGVERERRTNTARNEDSGLERLRKPFESQLESDEPNCGDDTQDE